LKRASKEVGMEGLFWAALGTALAVFAFIVWLFSRQRQEFGEQLVTWGRKLWGRLRGWKPIAAGTVKLPPAPPTDYGTLIRPVEFGNLVFPMKVLVGGDGTIRYRHPDGIICVLSGRQFGLTELPKDVQEMYPAYLEKRRAIAKARGATFEQREHVRLDDYEIRLRLSDDAPWPLQLILSTTDYYTIHATNYSLDELLPGGSTLREKYARHPGDLRNSILANPLAVNLSIVTADHQVCLAIRGRKTATTPEGYAPAVSGTGNPRPGFDLNEAGDYSPFLTAVREASEEALASKPSMDEVTIFGLARTLRYQLPFLFGELRLRTLTAAQVKAQFPRDQWETEGLISIPLNPQTVIDFVRHVYRYMEAHQIVGSATYAALFSILQSLRYQYPDEWDVIVAELIEVQPRR
jgi:hypothetical protein